MNKKQSARRPFAWMNPKLEIRNTKEYGNGVFAKKDIKKDEKLVIFGGYIKSIIEEEKSGDLVYNESVQISEDHCLGILNPEDLEDSSFFNHSCNPNAGFKGQIFLVAMKNIKKDEQIVFDYAMALSKAKNTKFFKMKCLCGSKNCRGYITDNDWKKAELQKKYAGYFQWYLQEKIKK